MNWTAMTTWVGAVLLGTAILYDAVAAFANRVPCHCANNWAPEWGAMAGLRLEW